MIPKKFVLLGMLMVLPKLIVCSQTSVKDRASWIVDIAGTGGFYSLSGEYLLTCHENYSIGAHVGFGYFPIKNTSFMSVPAGLHAIIGSGKHHLEFGLGLSYIQGLQFVPVQLQGARFSPIKPQNEMRYFPLRAFYYSPTIGYRFDKMEKGLIFRIYYSPMIVAKDLFSMDKFIDDAIPDNYVIGNFTKKEYYDQMIVGEKYPMAENEPLYFGLSLGYRF